MADYRAVEPALLHELDLAFFDDRFEGATPTEQLILEAMGAMPARSASPTSGADCRTSPAHDVLVRRRGVTSNLSRGRASLPRSDASGVTGLGG